ncbi:MAG: hypothetical protein LBI13_10585 [Streptococcaceae bacterium]|jgi:uncharacterized glyoxalase superfamily protein PhnB|nr:hypothetical protein [Streptococcaceae bacterium]
MKNLENERRMANLSINLFVNDLEKNLKFYEEVFAARRLNEDHFMIGNNLFALAEIVAFTPKERGGVGLCLQVWVADLEATIRLALKNGANYSGPSTPVGPIFITVEKERVCNISDLSGHVWSLTQR